MNCGTPAAKDARTCIMCGHSIDRLPQQASSFGASWLGILTGLVVISGFAWWIFRLGALMPPARPTATATATAAFLPPTDTPTPTVTLTPPPAPSMTFTPTPTPEPLIHTIKTGETLIFIADKYNVTVDEINAENGLSDGALLSVGQELIIPFPLSSTGTEADSRERPIIKYVIKGGDTLSGIAFEYDTSISAIELANPDLNLDLLSVGQEIVVPLRPPTLTPTPTITPTPTFTPPPPFRAPALLLPADGALIEGDQSTVLLSWTTTGLLSDNHYYVIYLTDDTDHTTTFQTRGTSYRLPAEARPNKLTTYSWYVMVMEKIGIDKDGIFRGKTLSPTGETRTFQWR